MNLRVRAAQRGMTAQVWIDGEERFDVTHVRLDVDADEVATATVTFVVDDADVIVKGP